MADSKSRYEILIETDAELRALQQSRKSLDEMSQAAKSAGGSTKALEAELAAIDAQIGKRKLAAYTQDLQETASAMRAAGKDASELEKRLALVQGAGGGDEGGGKPNKLAKKGLREGLGGLVGALAPALSSGTAGLGGAAFAAVAIAEKVGEARKETRLWAQEQAGVTKSFAQTAQSANYDQLIGGIDEFSAHTASARKQLNETLNPNFSESPLKYLGAKAQDFWSLVGIQPSKREVGAEAFKAQKRELEEMKDRALSLSKVQTHASELAADGHKRESDAILRKAESELKIRKLLYDPALNGGAGVALAREEQARFENQEAQIKRENALADEKAVRALEGQASVQRLLLDGHTRAAEDKKRELELDEKLRDIRADDAPDKIGRIDAVSRAYQDESARIARERREADANALAQRGTAAQAGALRLGGLDVAAGQVERAQELRKEIDGITHSGAGIANQLGQITQSVVTAASRELLLVKQTEESVREKVKALETDAQVQELIAAGAGIEAAQLAKSLTLEQQIAAIKRDAALTPAQREREIAALRDADRRKTATAEQLRKESAKEELDDVRRMLAIRQAEADGDKDRVARLSIEKELADKLLAIEKEKQAGKLTGPEAADRAAAANAGADASRLALSRDQFNKEFDTNVARANEKPADAARRREGERIWRQQQRSEIQRELNRWEAAQPGGSVTQEQRDAKRAEIEAARGKEVENFSEKIRPGAAQKARRNPLDELNNGEAAVPQAGPDAGAGAQAQPGPDASAALGNVAAAVESAAAALQAKAVEIAAGVARIPDALQPLASAVGTLQSQMETVLGELFS